MPEPLGMFSLLLLFCIYSSMNLANSSWLLSFCTFSASSLFVTELTSSEAVELVMRLSLLYCAISLSSLNNSILSSSALLRIKSDVFMAFLLFSAIHCSLYIPIMALRISSARTVEMSLIDILTIEVSSLASPVVRLPQNSFTTASMLRLCTVNLTSARSFALKYSVPVIVIFPNGVSMVSPKAVIMAFSLSSLPLRVKLSSLILPSLVTVALIVASSLSLRSSAVSFTGRNL